ncbi:MAG: hypothetical protein PHQ86_09310, partial [Dehalococcoidales bacterium]|nr:hypothetical protein [Dehalococcoidales bacterium]
TDKDYTPYSLTTTIDFMAITESIRHIMRDIHLLEFFGHDCLLYIKNDKDMWDKVTPTLDDLYKYFKIGEYGST